MTGSEILMPNGRPLPLVVRNRLKHKHPVTCPEALYWNVGDVIIKGKGDCASFYVVIDRKSATTVLVHYLRQEHEYGRD